MPRKKTEKEKPAQIDELDSFEWSCLVAAWRYYENRATIASATFPRDMVERYWTSCRYTRKVLDLIANQFAKIDHGLRGEKDWDGKYTMDCDRLPWTAFYQFCKGWCDGFNTILVRQSPEMEMTYNVQAFHVDWCDRWYIVFDYLKHDISMYINPECIVDVNGKKEGVDV